MVAAAAYWFIYNYPDTAEFLSEKERTFIHDRLASDSDATHDEKFTWGNVAKALRDPKCWLYGMSFHTMSLPLYTFSLFLVCRVPQAVPCRGSRAYQQTDPVFSQPSSRTSGSRQPRPSY